MILHWTGPAPTDPTPGPWKWLGMLFAMIGMILTSFDVYPLNIVLAFAGGGCWGWAGWRMGDRPLVIGSWVACAFYLIGFLHWLSHHLPWQLIP